MSSCHPVVGSTRPVRRRCWMFVSNRNRESGREGYVLKQYFLSVTNEIDRLLVVYPFRPPFIYGLVMFWSFVLYTFFLFLQHWSGPVLPSYPYPLFLPYVVRNSGSPSWCPSSSLDHRHRVITWVCPCPSLISLSLTYFESFTNKTRLPINYHWHVSDSDF